PSAPFAQLLPLFAGGALALTAALAVACFVKAFGVAFLALPRSPRAASAHEVGRLEIGAMGLLALACVGVGLAAGPAVAAIGALVPVAAIGGASDAVAAVGAAGRLSLAGLAAMVGALAVVAA